MNFIRIMHDNSGKGSMASWYLKYVVVHDLQTKTKYYFYCDDWLAVEKGNGTIDRIIPVAGEKQRSEISLSIKNQTKNNFSDGHLWFSIFAKPVQSAFSRFERVTCCFVLMYISMLMNILYYGSAPESSGGFRVGPFYLTFEQVNIR